MDLVIINESELRLELRKDKVDLNIIAYDLIKNKIKNLIVTQGKMEFHFLEKTYHQFIVLHLLTTVDKVGLETQCCH